MPRVKHLPEEAHGRWLYYKLWPNMAFDIYADQIDFMQWLPVSPTTCLLREVAYALPDSRREMKLVRYANWRINRVVNAEDTWLISRCSRAWPAAAMAPARSPTSEVCLRSFAKPNPRLDSRGPPTLRRPHRAGARHHDQNLRRPDHRRRATTASSARSISPSAGMRVRVLERRHVVGGAAVTEEFHPGFRNSTASYTVSLLRPKVIADMKLHDHGYRVIERTISNFFPFDNDYVKLGGGAGRTEAEFARFSKGRGGLSEAMTRRWKKSPGAARHQPCKSRPMSAAACRRWRGGAAGLADGQARPGHPARPARHLHQVGARVPRRLVRGRPGAESPSPLMRWSATMPGYRPRVRPMSCCTTCSAK
jgi:hypothetical protein